MKINPIRNSADHDAAVTRIGELWEAKPGSNDFAELNALVTLVDAYERELIPLPDLTDDELAEILQQENQSDGAP